MPRKPAEVEIEEAPEDEADEEEEVEEEEEEQEEDQAAAPPPPPPKARPRAKRKPREIGAPRAPRTQMWESEDADLKWGELLSRLGHGEYADLDAFGVEIRIARAEDTTLMLASVNGGAVRGTIGPQGEGLTPSAHFRKWVIERVHRGLPGGGQQRYTVFFIRRATGYKVITRGILTLPSMDQLIALQRMQDESAQQEGAAPAPYGFGAPPGAPAPGYHPHAGFGAPPGYPAQWPGYPPGYPPAPGPAGVSVGEAAMRAELGELRGHFAALVTAVREGTVPPPVPAAPLPVAPAQAPSVDQIVDAALTRLYGTLPRERAGVGVGVGVGAAPPAVVAQVVPPQSMQEMAARAGSEVSALGAMFRAMKDLKTISRQAETLFGGASEVVDAAEEEPAKPPAMEEPWVTSPIPMATTRDGRSVNLSRDPKTGKVHLMGTLMSNPVFVEKAIETAGPFFAAIIAKTGLTIPGTEPEPAPVAAARPAATPAAPPPASPPDAPRTSFPNMS